MNIKIETENVPDSTELPVQKFCWDCKYCNKLYASKYNLDLHIERMHTVAKCAICGEVFLSISLLRKHHNEHHSNDVELLSAQNDGKCSKTTPDKSRKLTKMPASSEKKKNRDTQIKGESFENIALNVK